MTVTLKTSGVVSAPGTASWNTSAFTPAAGALIVAMLFVRDTGGSGDIAASLTCVDGTNTYTARVTQGMAGGAKMQGRIWTAPEAAGASRTITFDAGANSVGAALWFIYEVTGYNTSTPTGATASDAATFPIDGAATLTLSGAPATTSDVISGCGIDGDVSGTIAVTPGAAWTEDGEVGNTTVQSYAQAQRRTASSSTSVDWVDVRAGTMATFSGVGLALEIKAAATAGPPFRDIQHTPQHQSLIAQ